MLTLALSLFVAGMLTILLPCILPVVPIVIGASIVDRHPFRPVAIAGGMVLSFVASTFLLQVVLGSFVELADVIRIATYYVLFLFGVGFLIQNRLLAVVFAVIGAVFFWEKGLVAVLIAVVAGVIAIEGASRVATWLQQLGSDIQGVARASLGATSLLSSFAIGASLGLVWAPCAGPALGFALALVRDEPGAKALALLSCYALGSAVPLLLIGYGGQRAVAASRQLLAWSGTIKHVAGVLLIVLAIALRFGFAQAAQVWVAERVNIGALGERLERALFPSREPSSSPEREAGSKLPVLGVAPEFTGLGRWHNSEPLTMKELRGKVVLVDFWTYSCINCIRTLPYIRQYWSKYQDSPFVLVGIHTPEFTFEKSETNVARAIKDHELTYPIAQDSDFGTWNAFGNRYWPAKYLIDAEGRVRYTHFGEGAYEETDEAIASLLAEIGISASGSGTTMSEASRPRSGPITPETYLHSRSWQAFENSDGGPDEAVHTYEASSAASTNRYVLGGQWQLEDDERQVLRSSEGEVRITAVAGEVNLVLGLEEGARPAQAEVVVDGKSTKTFTVDHHDLYPLYLGEYGTHDIRLVLKGAGVAAYAYTFGG